MWWKELERELLYIYMFLKKERKVTKRKHIGCLMIFLSKLEK